MIRLILNELKIKCKVAFSSELAINTIGTNALVEICKKVKSTEYISGEDGSKYLDMTLFKNENLKIQFQKYKHPTYEQRFEKFEPYMCILDLLFNEGPNSLKIIKAGRYYES